MTENAPPAGSPGSPRIQDYTKLAGTYDEYRYVEDVHVQQEARRRRTLVSLLPHSLNRAADIACGTGRGLAVLSSHAKTVVGVDGTHAMLAVAKTKLGGSAKVTQSNAASLPFPDGTFDLVTCLNFVHLFGTVAEKATFVSEMGRVLRPGGTLIVEFDNALQGVFLGGVRKYFGQDIGYDWPWQMRHTFDPERFQITRMAGANLPFIWRVPVVAHLDRLAPYYPFTFLASRIFVQARRR